MIALSVDGVGLSFGADEILKNISFSVNDGDRVGIIGVNGAGKTSLFRIITGEYTADAGDVYIQKGHTVGILEQNPDLSALPGEMSSLEYMYTAFPSLIELEERIARTEIELRQAAEKKDEERMMALSSRLSDEERRYREGGGLEFRGRCRGMLMRLGFDEVMISQKLSTLSGGQYTRLALARLLATEPDILMLDEPTNHLDIDALAWLESYIASYKKTVLIISHDRYFLDRTTSKTLHILYGRARLYPAAYTKAKEMMMKEADSLEKRYKEQQKEIARIRANIEFQRRCNREHNFVTIRAKEKQLDRMELVELAPKAPKDIRMRFSALEESAGDVMTVRGLGFSYGEKVLIRDLDFLVRSGERVMILGPNGSGKSTLMKLMNSRMTPTEGSITLGYNIKIGYYDQENRGLSENKTVFEEMHDEYPEKKDLELRSTLALFLFGAEDIDKPISTLSGGERARLTLAKLILKKVNLLILDEPTNHLDIGSCEALETALIAFPGTIIAVSHDRYFINSIATRIIELAPGMPHGMMDCVLEDYDDAYAEYLRLRERIHAEIPKEEKRTTDSREEYEAKKRENARRRGEERRLERARARIPEIEAELERLEEELFGEAASDYKRAAEIEEEKARLEEELMELYELVMD
ncbi:MAG: ABC-F family ATP-binding cassette domain-containing protein [Clostridia bacterium]|nr:ABC-F family ATP-binding cassette domain-containing protein [Clostridia bacterium]